ncbi:CPBP family intramembrane metalloprotease [Patescibacteria group bacterium AH-259-L05]|nr:CPBP family intramembrane metalloprotease [Patescibacteria group bacterium AH-259-L05]
MNKNQTKTATQIGTLFVLPVLLIVFGVIPVQYRFFVLLAITILVTTVIIIEKLTLKELGIRLDNIKRSVSSYFLLTVFATIAIIVLARLLGHNTQSIAGNIHFQYGFIILSFLQEFLFRSFLIPKLKVLTASPTLVIISNGLLFGFIHLIFPNIVSLFILSSVLGAGFAAVYFFRPNLLLATAAHVIINFVAVFYCFASFSASC